MAKSIYKEQGIEILDDGRILLIVCPKCHSENYAPNVNSGVCTWCGYNAHQDKELTRGIKQHQNKK